MNKIMNGGTTICGDHKSVVIKNGQVYIDGELVSDQRYNYNGPIIINGNVEEVDGVNITINGDVHGDVDGTTIQIKGSVLGDVDGTTVNIGNNKSEKKTSDIADNVFRSMEYLSDNSYPIERHDELKRNLEEMKNIILNDPTLTQDYNNFYGIDTNNADENGNLHIIANKKNPKVTISDKPNEEDILFTDGEWTAVAGIPREENEISLKDLVKKKKRRK